MLFSVENKGTKFVFPEQDDVPDVEKASIVIRPITNDVIRGIMESCAIHRVELRPLPTDEKKHAQVEWDDYDNDVIYEKSWDYCIVSWDNVCIDDKLLNCTNDNKLLLLGNDPFFASCVVPWRNGLEKALDKHSEEIEKNLLSTSKDSTPNHPATSV